MRQAVEGVVSVLCATLLDERCPHDDGTCNADVYRFVLAQWARMPDYLRLPMLLVTLGFDWSAIAFTGRRFQRGNAEQRARQVQRWRNSRLSVCRDLIRFYESLAVFGWHSFTHGRQHHQTVSQSQARRTLAG
jgi:hypothetical protein